MKRTALSVALSTAMVLSIPTSIGAAAAAEPTPPTVVRSLILDAFGDAGGTYGESQPFINAMTSKLDRTGDSTYCEAVVEGLLYGQAVTVVVTGTGGGNSGPCTQEMLGWYSPNIKELIWSGIGGVTPAVGGMYDTAGRILRNPAVMIGDACIGVASWSWDLHFSNVNDWAAAHPTAANQYGPAGGWWQMMNAKGQQVAPGFDNVQQFTVAGTALADEILTASKTVQLPGRPASVAAKIARFHPDKQQWREPRYYSYKRCGGEQSGDNFWHGATEDLLSRQYMAKLMQTSGLNAKAKAGNIVLFSAMEAVPWMSAVARWNKANGTDFPMAVIRAASNYDQIPLRPNGQPVLGKNGKPLNAMQDILLGFDNDSSAYAAATAAAPVLSLFRNRSSA